MGNENKRIEMIFEGKKYIRRGEKWTDSSYIVVPETVQRKLYDAYSESIDISGLHYNSLIEEADRFKESSSYDLAIKYYEEAIRKGSQSDIRYILPRITSCYRLSKQPQKAIALFSEIKRKYGAGFFSPALLTSAAAAYCDMNKYTEAKKCIDRAYAMSGGKSSPEMNAVYGRLRKEANIG